MTATPGSRYRVLKAFKSTDMRMAWNAHSSWHENDPYTFEVGEEVEYVGLRTGMFTDGAFNTILRTADGVNHEVLSGWSVSPVLDPANGFTELLA